MNFTIPVKLVSEANQREHWAAKNRRKKQQREIVAACCHSAGIARYRPSEITLTRIYAGRGKPMDDDNNAGSFKHVQDAIAYAVAIDDGTIQWTYAQERGDEYGVRVEFDL